MVVESWL